MEMTAIGWAVSPIIRFMIDKTLGYLKKPLKRTYGMEADLEKLKQILPEVQSVVSVAETLKVVNPHQLDLLRKMKEAVYDAEDVVDEFNYRLLEAEAAKEDSVAEKLSAMVLTAGKRLVGADPLQRSLSKAIESLKCIDRTANAFIRAFNLEKTADQAGQSFRPQPTRIASGRETVSNLHENIIVGREADCKNILCKIQEQANSDCSIPLVICIVGEGGIGKTTLAQLVYNHEAVASNVFDQKIWVCVANNFDEVRVTKQVLSEVRPQNIEYASWDKTVKELQESLHSKKSLIVLDDVWVERDQDTVMNREAWKKFFSTFNRCRGGNSIVVTTRLTSVVKMIGNCMKVNLSGLSVKDSTSLFMSHAFSGWESGATCSKELETIGEKIVDKLNGLPLALKFVGMHLSDKHSVDDWEVVLKNTKRALGNVLSVLKLSYDHLPSHLKHCFAYCSLFPKGWYFSNDDVEQLIQMWIAQGFVHKENEDARSLEVIGRCYFDDLCSRFFFQTINKWNLITSFVMHNLKNDLALPVSYVMHDLINDLALYVSKEECCQMLNDQSCIPSTLRHVSVSSIHLPILSKITRIDKLRTMLVLNPSKVHVCIPMCDEILASLIGARVLDLSGCCIEKLPENIKQMIHLRYLAFDRTSMLLPETCSRLFNLQVVRMTGYRSETRDGIICKKGLDGCAPKNMRSLNNLSHVYVPNGYPVEIIGHWKIPQFHGNAVFTLNHDNKLEDIHDIGFQGNLAIQKLESAGSKHDDLKPVICQNELMKELKLEWCSSALVSRNNDNDVLEVLQPPSNLSSLEVCGYRGSKFPFWLKNNYLTNLSSLHLRNCSELRELPPLGQLPKLQTLELSELNAVEEISPEFYGTKDAFGFPCLKLLYLGYMHNLIEWSIPECNFRPLFPLLEEMFIIKCSKLKRVPNIFPVTEDLKRLYIDGKRFEFAFVSCAPMSSFGGQDNFVEKLREIISKRRRPFFCISGWDPCLLWKVTDFSGFKFVSGDIESLFKVQTCKLEMLDFRSHPEVVKDLYLFNCRSKLSEIGFTKLSSLESLSIEYSKRPLWFRALHEEDVALLPTSLKSLAIKNSWATSNFFSRYFQSLSALVQLELEYVSLREGSMIDLHWLTSLTELRIKYCKYLTGIIGFKALTCLTTIEIKGSPRLSWKIDPYDFLKPVSSLSTFKIRGLYFHSSKDNILDLQHCRELKVLHIRYCKGKFKLINCSALTSLAELVIYKCRGLIIDPVEFSFLKSLQNLELKLNDWAPPLLHEGANEVQVTKREDKAETKSSDCSINEFANGTGYPSGSHLMLHGSSLQPECVKPSWQLSRLETSAHSGASGSLINDGLFKDVEFDRLGLDGLSLRDWIIFRGTCASLLEFYPPHDLFRGENKIIITNDDIKDLMKMNWLNVSVIQLYMMKLYNICQNESIQNIGFMDPERVNATFWGKEKHATITYIAETMQSRQTILAPYFEDYHWVLLVIKPSEGTVYVLDSLSNRRDKNYVIKDAFAQAMQGSATFSWITDYPSSPQQIGGFECGYYVMNLMQDIITTNREFPKGSLPQNYTELETDSVCRSWIQFFLELLHAKVLKCDHQRSQELPVGDEEDKEEDTNEV